MGKIDSYSAPSNPINFSVLSKKKKDTARFKYGSHWIKLPLLVDAMRPLDPDTGRSRGFVTLVNPRVSAQSSNLPVSVFLRSKMKDYTARKEFKVYLTELKKSKKNNQMISFEDVASFWTKGGSEPNYIWDVVQLNCIHPDSQEVVDSINDVRGILSELLNSTDGVKNFRTICPEILEGIKFCRQENSHSDCYIRTEEAIYVMYLASLSETSRHDILHKLDNTANMFSCSRKRGWQQLMAEAKLVEYAIEVSDEI